MRAIEVAPLGDVWFATDGGLVHLDRSGGEVFTDYTVAEGLPSDTVRDVGIDVENIGGADHEVVWAATSGGLARIDVLVPPATAVTGFNDNNLYSVFVDVTDHVKYVGTASGLEVYRGL